MTAHQLEKTAKWVPTNNADQLEIYRSRAFVGEVIINWVTIQLGFIRELSPGNWYWSRLPANTYCDTRLWSPLVKGQSCGVANSNEQARREVEKGWLRPLQGEGLPQFEQGLLVGETGN